MEPTLEGWKLWLQVFMGVPVTATPSDNILLYTFDAALNIAYIGLATMPSLAPAGDVTWSPPSPSQQISPSVYAMAVYNLAADILVRTAQDQPGQDPPTYWADLRTKLGVGAFSPGFITSSADQGTSEGMTIINQLKNMTLGDLLLMQTPWGRAYLALVSSWGTLWGIS